MTTVTLAVAPIFAIILLGHLLQRTNFPGKGFWPQAERLTYYLLFPALLVGNMARADISDAPVAAMGAGLIVSILLATALATLLRRVVSPGGPAFTSLIQGAIRMNTYIGLSTAWALFGDQGLVLSAVPIIVIIPLVNVICVFSLSRTCAPHDRPNNGTLAEIVRNPLILGCLGGITLNLLGIRPSWGIDQFLDILARASLPLGLLSVGAGLRLHSVLEGKGPVLASSAIKLLIAPLSAWAVASALGVTGAPLTVVVIFSALPTSVSSFILARQMGGDHHLMAAIITAQTALSVLTLPLAVALLR